MITQQSGDLYSTPGSVTGPRGRVEQASKALSPGVVMVNLDRGQPPGHRTETGLESPRGVQPHRGATGHRRCSLQSSYTLGCLSERRLLIPQLLPALWTPFLPPRRLWLPAGFVSPEESGFFIRSFIFFFFSFLILCNILPTGALKKVLLKNRPLVSYRVSRFTRDPTWFPPARGRSRPRSPQPP